VYKEKYSSLHDIKMFSHQPLISVIIPNYNHTRFIPTAIKSVLNQTYPRCEIIVVDDGSTDDSREVVAQFGDKVRYIWQKNQGLAGTRNTGIQAAAGEMIALLDADDEWAPEFLDTMIRLAGENPNGLVFYCMAQCMDVDGNDLPQLVGGPPVAPEALYQKLLRANFIIPSTVIFKRQPLLEAGSFDASLRSCEDWDMWLRLLPAGQIIGTAQTLVRYRVHGSSLSTNVANMQDAARKVVEKHFGGEEGDPATWSNDKRRAYGGLYRYQTITFIQRQNNWTAAASTLQKSLLIDPTLTLDLDFFYELGLGSQQVGHRGVSDVQNQTANALALESCVLALPKELGTLRSRAIGTAEYALGLLAYGFGQRSACRRYFAKAIAHRPELSFDIHVLGNYFKSFINREAVTGLKKILGRTG